LRNSLGSASEQAIECFPIKQSPGRDNGGNALRVGDIL
jgi:hypothetical protein